MAAMSFDNVIRFPDGARGPGLGPDRVHTLKDARNLMVQRLREAFRALLAGLTEELAARADRAESSDQRSHYYRTRDALRDSEARLETLLGVHWLRLFDDAVRGNEISTLTRTPSSLDELQLVDFGEVDAELATKSIAGRFRDGCEEGLFAAGRRLAFLAGRDDDSLPLESTVSGALRASLDEAGLAQPVRLEVLQGIESRVVPAFSPVVEELNDFLAGRNILPTLKRSFARTAGKKEEAGRGARQEPDAAGDVFSVLQRLVAGGVPALPAGAPGLAAGPAGLAGPAADAIPSVAMMTQVMERAMASLDVLQHSIPVVLGAAPSTNVLRDFRASESGKELGYLDAVTVDIVATLFDFIFDDKGIADPIKALIGRLQIPVLKVAMLDKSFFSSKAHPARRLLDVISRAAVRCGPAAGHEDPLYARIQAIIDRLQNEFAQDTHLFEELCGELEAFLDGQEQVADALAARAAPLVAAQEQKELAALAAEQAIAGWISLSLPAAVTDLLEHEWRALLIRLYMDNDEEAWGDTASTIGELVASVQPQPDVKDRKALAVKLPALVKRIHDGLNRLDIPDNRRLAVIDSLFSLHAAVLRGAAPVVSDIVPPEAPEAAPVAEIASEHMESGEAQLDHLTVADAFVAADTGVAGDTHSQVAHLQRGDWVEFLSGEGGPARYRLAWVSPQRGILLFTNPDSPRALSVAPAALVLQIERGEAVIVSAEPIFDRAVSRALESLQAA